MVASVGGSGMVGNGKSLAFSFDAKTSPCRARMVALNGVAVQEKFAQA